MILFFTLIDLPKLTEVLIGVGFCNILLEDFAICNYLSLERIVCRYFSLVHLNSFKIYNNEKLKEIIIDDGHSFTHKGIAYFEGAMSCIQDVVFEGMWFLLFCILIKLDLPNVETIYFGYGALSDIKTISISSKIIVAILIVRYSKIKRDNNRRIRV